MSLVAGRAPAAVERKQGGSVEHAAPSLIPYFPVVLPYQARSSQQFFAVLPTPQPETQRQFAAVSLLSFIDQLKEREEPQQHTPAVDTQVMMTHDIQRPTAEKHWRPWD